jgi:CHAT domain-containing protein/uncharacterized protein YebE (UPF0316 family)
MKTILGLGALAARRRTRTLAGVLLLGLAVGVLAYVPPVFSQTGTTASANSAEGDKLMHEATSSYRKGNTSEAVGFWEKALVAYTRDLGPDAPDTLAIMNVVAAGYSAVGRNAEALKLREETLGLWGCIWGAYHPHPFHRLNDLAISYRAVGRNAEALKLWEETLVLRRNKLGVDDPDTIQSINNLAIGYNDVGRNAEALKLREEVLALRRKKLGEDHPDTLNSMNGLAASYRAVGRNAEALKLWDETLARRRGTLGADHPDTLQSMGNLATIYSEVGRDADALKLREETLALMRNKLGADHPDTLKSMGNLAGSYDDVGRDAEALKLREQTLALTRRKLGADHPDTLASMNNLAISYHAVGRNVEELKLREETFALMRNKLGPDHPDTLVSMGNLASSYSDAGRIAEALALREKNLSLTRGKLGAAHPHTLSSMGQLATSYSAAGRDAEALKLREETLALMRSRLGVQHPDTLSSMSNLASSYSKVGRHAEVLKLREETLTLRRSKLGTDHPDTLNSMNDLAAAYSAVGRNVEALELWEKTLALRRSKLGADHPNTLTTMHNLAVGYAAAGRHAEALKLREETLTLRRSKLGTDHPDTLAGMANLANSYGDAGRNAEALKLREETLALMRRKLGADHPDTLASMINLAASYGVMARRPEALALRRQSLAVIDRMAASLKILPREERSTALGSYLSQYADFARELASNPTDYAEALTVTERAKARALLEELTARQAIDNSGIPAADARGLADLHSSLEYIDGKLAAAPNDDARTPLRTQRDALHIELETLHHALMAKYPRYAGLSAVKQVTLEQGRTILPPRGAFISWLYDDRTAGVALALSKAGELQVVQSIPGQEMIARAESYRWLLALPDADSFAMAVQTIPLAAWREDGVLYIGGPDKHPAKGDAVSPSQYMALRQQAIRSHGQWLSDTLLKPLAARIDLADQWIISPDGVLATIPWDTLPWKGQPLGQQKQITVVQSLSVYKLLKDREAEYLRARAGAPGTQALLVMGGALYDSAPNKQRSFQRAPQIVINGATTAAVEYQRQNAYDYMRSRHWPNLPGTLREAKTLHGLMGGRMFTGRDASKATLRALSQSGELATYRNLHFAAHGYLDTTVPSLSALVLSATGEDENNDGYITAGEWPAFNLRSDLLVMSACETGLGKVISGEGVQGMPYALYVAGNRDTLLSLWQVSDNATSVFMKRFWEKVKAGQNHAQALTETKREFQRGDAGKAYAEPYYWAPFVLYGVQD